MLVFKCKMCGGTIEFAPGDTVGVCDSCGTKQTLPRLDNDRKANLYDRANHFRRNNDYDKAMGIYEQILNEDNTDAEAYWSLVLCRYGIEYVEDPATHKRVPTVNRTQYTSIFADEDYKSALQYADGSQKEIYQQEAAAIDKIQKDILEISQKEKPFDVFICYKETDNSGRRTPDSVLANDLYHQLTQEGFKVFFSRITLEDKLGSAYEPYIFAALNSAKVMVVLGTKPEYLNAVWVKNEWSRYLALIKAGAKKVLIPAYRDMDPYDLPEEFSHLQAQDMAKLGFMQDLIRGIQKLTQPEKKQDTGNRETPAPSGNAGTAPLLRRVFLFLEDENWQEADEYCEKILDQEPECGEAYLGKLMAELHVTSREKLADCTETFEESNNYQKILRFGSGALVAEVRGDIAHIQERNERQRKEKIYNRAVSAMAEAKTEDACMIAESLFQNIPGFKDADTLAGECKEKAEACRKDGILEEAVALAALDCVEDIEEALEKIRSVSGWKDSDALTEKFTERITALQEEAEKRKAENEIAQQKKRKTRLVAICCTALALAILIPVGVFMKKKMDAAKLEEERENLYNEAVTMFSKKEYAAAADAFESLNDYKDSKEKYLEAYKKAHPIAVLCDFIKENGEHFYNKQLSNMVEIAEGYDYQFDGKGGPLHVVCDVSDFEHFYFYFEFDTTVGRKEKFVGHGHGWFTMKYGSRNTQYFLRRTISDEVARAYNYLPKEICTKGSFENRLYEEGDTFVPDEVYCDGVLKTNSSVIEQETGHVTFLLGSESVSDRYIEDFNVGVCLHDLGFKF